MDARAVFLDRDGTINEEVGYLRDPDQVQLLPGAAAAIRALREAGWRVIVVTNQSGIARGYLDRAALGRIHDRLMTALAEQGAAVDDILFCPHHPDDGCACRKPRAGLLEAAQSRFGLDLSTCWVVGDQASDVALGRRAGCHTALVLTGYGPEQRAVAEPPDLVAADLGEAARRILSAENGRCKKP